MNDQSIGVLFDDTIVGRAAAAGREGECDPSAVVGPRRTIYLMRAVIRAGRESSHGAVVAEFEILFRATREWNVAFGVVIDGAAFGIVAVHVHPTCTDQCVSRRRIYHSDRRGPANVARMRATCCVVNMNMASSSV